MLIIFIYYLIIKNNKQFSLSVFNVVSKLVDMEVQESIYMLENIEKSCIRGNQQERSAEITLVSEFNKLYKVGISSQINYKIGPETKRRDPQESERKIISLEYQVYNLKQLVQRYEFEIKYKEQIQEKLISDSETQGLREIFELFVDFRETYANQSKKQNKNAFMEFKNVLKSHLNGMNCEFAKKMSDKSVSNQSSYSLQQQTLEKYQGQILTLIQTINEKQEYIEFLENKFRSDLENVKRQQRNNYYQSSEKKFLNSHFESNPYETHNNSQKLMKSFEMRENQVLMDLNNISEIPLLQNFYKKSIQRERSIRRKECDIKSYSSLNKKNQEFIKHCTEISQIIEIPNKKLVFREFNIVNQVDIKINGSAIQVTNQKSSTAESKKQEFDQVYKSYKSLLKKYLELNSLCWMMILKLSMLLKREKKFTQFNQKISDYIHNVKYEINNLVKWFSRLKIKVLSFTFCQLLSYIRLCEQQIKRVFQYNHEISEIIKTELI